MILTADLLGLDEKDYFGGFDRPSLATSVAEGALAVAVRAWVLGFAQPGGPAGVSWAGAR